MNVTFSDVVLQPATETTLQIDWNNEKHINILGKGNESEKQKITVVIWEYFHFYSYHRQ